MELPSPYEILGIEKTDNLQEIKQAYKTMALKYHPDKNANGGDKFQEINKAYHILSNEDSKLFFDSFGYEGLILNEKLNSRGENNFTEWLISMSFCLLSIVLDHFFGIYTEWIFASIFTLYFIYLTKRSPDISFCIFIVVSNVVLYFLLPTKILPTITNTIIYGIVLLWPNITRKNSSLTVSVWILIIVFDLWRGITLNHWIWNVLSINIIFFGSIILMLMGIYVLKKPETGPAIYSTLFGGVLHYIFNIDIVSLVFIGFWVPIWTLDYFTNRRLEFIIPAAIFIGKMILLKGRLKTLFPLLVSSGIVYYLVPVKIYHFFNNYIIHALAHMLVYKFYKAFVTKSSDEELAKKYLGQKIINQIVTGAILLFIQYYLDFPTTSWNFLGTISLGYTFILISELYFFGFSIRNPEEDENEQQNNQNNSFNGKQKNHHNNHHNNNNDSAIQPYSHPSSIINTIKKSKKSSSPVTPLSMSPESSSSESSPNNFDSIESDDHQINSKSNRKSKSSSSLDKRCQTCFKSTDLKKCGRCKLVYYCSKECQIKNWAFHQSICNDVQNR